MKRIPGVVHRDLLEFNEQYPVNEVLKKPLLKKPKWCDKVILKFHTNSYYEAYVVAVNGGDMHNTLEQSMWGDQIELFVLPNRGVPVFMKGLKTLWLQDIGIGKTKEEADATYMKHEWFTRSKRQLQNDRFWSIEMDEKRKKDTENVYE